MRSSPDGATRRPEIIGHDHRYQLHDRLASGGMAAVYLGRVVEAGGFSRPVAIKRLHPQFAHDPEFVTMFLDEARLVTCIRHPNVVPTIDVVATSEELFLVMEYVPGETLSRLARASAARSARMPLPVIRSIFVGVLDGLHAAHEATDATGRPLGIVHRDVSPQNVLVGADGIARVLDFGVAKAAGRAQRTKSGVTKGKLAYMAPEQMLGHNSVGPTADVYATAVCLWEAVTGRRLFQADSEAAVQHQVLAGKAPSPLEVAPDLPVDVADLIMRGLDTKPGDRFPTAHAMARALAQTGPTATPVEVAHTVSSLAGEALAQRAAAVATTEPRWAARRGQAPAVFGASALALLTIAGVAAWGAAAHHLRTPARAPPAPSKLVAVAPSAPLPPGSEVTNVDPTPAGGTLSASPLGPRTPVGGVSSSVRVNAQPRAPRHRPVAATHSPDGLFDRD